MLQPNEIERSPVVTARPDDVDFAAVGTVATGSAAEAFQVVDTRWRMPAAVASVLVGRGGQHAGCSRSGARLGSVAPSLDRRVKIVDEGILS